MSVQDPEERNSLNILAQGASEWPSWLNPADGNDQNLPTEEKTGDSSISSDDENIPSFSTSLDEIQQNGYSAPALLIEGDKDVLQLQLETIPVSKILNPAVWSTELTPINFADLSALEDFLIASEALLQQELEEKVYNTFTPFVRFHNDYQEFNIRKKNIANRHSSGPASVSSSLLSFLTTHHQSQLYMDGLSCVGMAIDLFNKLRVAFPERSDSFALVSCEEVVDDPSNYCIHSPNTKKEHVMVAARIALEDSDPRLGIVLLDPGYHINRPIVAMKDRLYPHTGWFVQDKFGKTVKEYNYELTGDEFVSWQVKEHKQARLKSWENLIYVRRAFTKSIEVTEKRSLIYNFKSFVVRTRKGNESMKN